jgi:hypothetical protein
MTRLMRRGLMWTMVEVFLALSGCASPAGSQTVSGALDLTASYPTGVTLAYLHSESCPTCRYEDQQIPEFMPDLRTLGVRFVKIIHNTRQSKNIRSNATRHFYCSATVTKFSALPASFIAKTYCRFCKPRGENK